MGATSPRVTAMKQAEPNWDTYSSMAQNYLNRPIFKGTPLNGQMFADEARQTYRQTGVYVPPSLALAQAQYETHMGKRTRSPNNIFNIGETDGGGHKAYDAPEDSVADYYQLMANRYYAGGQKTTGDLLNNFVDVNGNRYASNPNYENQISGQMNFINRYNGATNANNN